MAPAPCLPRSFPFAVVVVLVFSISGASGGLLGVDYGRDADNLIPPEKVVELLKANGIGAAAIYDGDARVIQAFRGSGIKLVVSLRNELLAQAARDPNFAGTWVWEHVGQYFPATQIEAVSVGNEVTHQRPDLTQFLLPAMQNVFNAISNLGHADKIKVSTPFAFSAVEVSFPPSRGSFRGDLQPLIRQILQFLDRTGSYFMISLYPFFAYRDFPTISREYFLGLPNPGVRDPVSGRVYKWLLHAQMDATFSAMAALGFGDTAGAISNAGGGYSRLQAVKRKVAVKETGCPSCSGRRRMQNRAILEDADAGGSILNASSLAQEKGCSVDNAQVYNSNLVQTILSGQTGTPLYPDADWDVYIFSLFNENLKPGPESERTFGLFYPDGTKVYDVPFPSPGAGGLWCVANPAVGWERMQQQLDWACGPGGVDCGPIQPGAACYEPNTVEAHTSYALNSYYQSHGRGAGTCDFSGVGQIVNQRPRFRLGVSIGSGRPEGTVARPAKNRADELPRDHSGGSTSRAPASSTIPPRPRRRGDSLATTQASLPTSRAPSRQLPQDPPRARRRDPGQLCEDGGNSWCVANPTVGWERMQAALNWACGLGGADCGPIQPGATCYEPNTVEAHASYAMNSYYQRHGRSAGTCDFSGVGQTVYQRPRFGNCDFPSS